jgi:hypothetical protein
MCPILLAIMAAPQMPLSVALALVDIPTHPTVLQRRSARNAAAVCVTAARLMAIG